MANTPETTADERQISVSLEAEFYNGRYDAVSTIGSSPPVSFLQIDSYYLLV